MNPGAPSALGQLAHLAFPLATGEQGVLDAQGIPAVLVQVSSERGPAAGCGWTRLRLEGVGRAVLERGRCPGHGLRRRRRPNRRAS